MKGFSSIFSQKLLTISSAPINQVQEKLVYFVLPRRISAFAPECVRRAYFSMRASQTNHKHTKPDRTPNEDVPNFVNQQMTPKQKRKHTTYIWTTSFIKPPCVRSVSRCVQSALGSSGTRSPASWCIFICFFRCVWCAPRLIPYAGSDRRSEINMKCLGIGRGCSVNIHPCFLCETWQTDGQTLILCM